LNVCDVSADKIAGNAEISNIKKILGLQTGKVYTSVADLRYGRLMLMTDQDHDGSHIRGLVMNLFLQQWPSLLKVPGFMCMLLTPIVKSVLHSRSKVTAAAHSGGKATKGAGSTAQPAKAEEDDELCFYSLQVRSVVAHAYDLERQNAVPNRAGL
jgi:DNA gyrase/topoisomerase IV subunit B